MKAISIFLWLAAVVTVVSNDWGRIYSAFDRVVITVFCLASVLFGCVILMDMKFSGTKTPND
jgi:hypothetical protein